jgi:hypothetical protein
MAALLFPLDKHHKIARYPAVGHNHKKSRQRIIRFRWSLGLFTNHKYYTQNVLTEHLASFTFHAIECAAVHAALSAPSRNTHYHVWLNATLKQHFQRTDLLCAIVGATAKHKGPHPKLSEFSAIRTLYRPDKPSTASAQPDR